MITNKVSKINPKDADLGAVAATLIGRCHGNDRKTYAPDRLASRPIVLGAKRVNRERIHF